MWTTVVSFEVISSCSFVRNPTLFPTVEGDTSRSHADASDSKTTKDILGWPGSRPRIELGDYYVHHPLLWLAHSVIAFMRLRLRVLRRNELSAKLYRYFPAKLYTKYFYIPAHILISHGIPTLPSTLSPSSRQWMELHLREIPSIMSPPQTSSPFATEKNECKHRERSMSKGRKGPSLYSSWKVITQEERLSWYRS